MSICEPFGREPACQPWNPDDEVRLAEQPQADDDLQSAYDLAFRAGFRAGRKCGENLARAEARRAADFFDAVTGDPEPALWQIGYVEAILSSLEAGTDQADKEEDPQAWHEAVRESRVMCDRLRAAVAEAI